MNIAIVGCGSIARVHAECVQKLSNHKLVAFADINEQQAQLFSRLYQGNAYGSYEEMLSKEEIDVIHICTPHYLHVPMALRALKTGHHVFMEKPPVISKMQLQELEELSTDRQLGFCFQNRYNPSVIEVKNLLNSGKAGNINGVRGIVTWNRNADYYTGSNWRGRHAMEGGGALINQSIHTLDLMVHFLGKPVSVDAVMANHHLKDIIDVEDMMEAYIRFEDQKIGCFYATTAYIADVPPLIELSCENVTIRIEDLDVTYYYKDGRQEKPMLDQRENLGKSYWGAGHLDCITDFYRSIEHHKSFSLNLQGIKDTILLLLATYESAESGKEIVYD